MTRVTLVFVATGALLYGCAKPVDTTQFVIEPNDVVSATVNEGASGHTIAVTLSKSAARRFASATKANVGKTLPIVIAGEVVSEPIVHEAISGRSLAIAGKEKAEADRIVEVLTN